MSGKDQPASGKQKARHNSAGLSTRPRQMVILAGIRQSANVAGSVSSPGAPPAVTRSSTVSPPART